VHGELLHKTKEQLLQHRWRWPSLSLHGVEGAFHESGFKTVIPRKVIGKFSVRIVPDMTNDAVCAAVTAHLESEMKKLGSPNKVRVCSRAAAAAAATASHPPPLLAHKMTIEHHGGPCWLSKPDHPNYTAAAAAIERVYGVQPDMIREGGSIPIANWLEDATGCNVCLLSIGACDDGAHSQNEKFNTANYAEGSKVMVAYMHELAKLSGPKPSLCLCPQVDVTMPGAFAFARGVGCKCEI